jgi:inner membrane protein
MTVYNHIAGGIVFTGTFCSLFDVNIFENKYTVAITIISCILPDVDHTKSLIGKIFFPLSKWLSIKFGHRTITHSLLIYFLVVFIVSFIERYYLDTDYYWLIVLFGFGSHLILDMVTVQGIPLFYPFNKNPCVIPANPDLRLRTGNIKTEGILLFIFSILTFTLQPLFANGFWSNYNKSFNTIEHIYREYKGSNICLEVDYSYRYYGNVISNKGFLVNASIDNLDILEDNSIVKIEDNANVVIDKLEFRKTDSIYSSREIIFNDVSLDSLNKILNNRYILKGLVFSNKKVDINNKLSNVISIENSINDFNVVEIIEDNKDLKNVESDILKEQYKVSQKRLEKSKLQSRLKEINENLKVASNYEKDKLIVELNSIKNSLSNLIIDESNLKGLYYKKNSINDKIELSFNGSIKYLVLE